jgi:GNAT superfamily N-acetyltransferase
VAYLELVTELLHRRRLADPVGGLWEAADLQWWSTRDPEPAAEFWSDGTGPVAAAVLTRWGPDRYGCDVLGDTGHGPAWDWVRERCAGLDAAVEMELPPGDAAARGAARAGFTEPAGEYETDWLDAAARRAPTPLPAGYALVPRPGQTGPHPLARRNGAEVETRLHTCSLYDPELDLAVRAPDGDVAGYALFWPDRRTGVGLVEPMRVEDAHAGRGLAGALLRAGLDRLADRGCRRLKVSHDTDNPAAERLYHGAGFVPGPRTQVLRRPTCS